MSEGFYVDPADYPPLDDNPPQGNDRHPVIPWLTAPRRRWLYRVCLAAVPVAVILGIADQTTAMAWIGLVAAILSGSVALPNIGDQP